MTITDEQRIAVARSYLDALVSHDASAVQFAADAVRYEVGVKTGRSGAHLRRSLERGPQFRVIGGIRELTATVTGEVVHTHYLLDTSVFGRNLVVAEIDETFVVPDDLVIHRIDAKIRPRLGPSLRRHAN
ncbi:hypothetical protein [Speluncibacter jeojiensis]|uniref:DUF8021 domain-containing protein n=1 Tax=Speluncibacter jeojiensis TaxID=2710754 RepID=A0A9X4M4L5_9ACTN|nr:hypothetical protein [Corynebacteriales bacterium D3-21]